MDDTAVGNVSAAGVPGVSMSGLVPSVASLRGMRLTVWRRGGLVVLAVAFLFSSTTALAAGSPSIRSEGAQAQRVLAEIQSINVDLGRASEAWDGARYRLGLVQAREQATRTRLAVARKSAQVAQHRLGRMLVDLYESDEMPWLAVFLGARSLDDVITRLDAEQRLSSAQAAVVQQVVTTRAALRRQARALAQEAAAARRSAAQAAARRSQIEAELQQRQQLLASIRTEIVALKAAERPRERELAREARIRVAQELVARQRAARLAAEQAALERRARARAAALDRARAAALARARSRTPAPPQAPSPPPPDPPATTTAPPQPVPPAAPAPNPSPAPSPPTTIAVPAVSPPSPSSAPSATGGNPQVVSIALRYLGVPYRWGGASPRTGFDCSGLVMYVFAQIGISLPHFAAAQYHYGTAVPRDQLEPGDLVFFDGLNHVGIYIGDGQFVHAPHTGDVVRISSLDEAWYSSNYVGARRIS